MAPVATLAALLEDEPGVPFFSTLLKSSQFFGLSSIILFILTPTVVASFFLTSGFIVRINVALQTEVTQVTQVLSRFNWITMINVVLRKETIQIWSRVKRASMLLRRGSNYILQPQLHLGLHLHLRRCKEVFHAWLFHCGNNKL